MTSALERLELELAAVAGVPVTLERPRDSSHGDYASSIGVRPRAGAVRSAMFVA